MKTVDTTRVTPWMKSVSLAVTTLAVAMLGTGCADECVDPFDCRADNGQPPAGEEWVCRDAKCDTVPVQTPGGPDAGTDDAGTDAGTGDAGTDAGTDAGSDPCDTATYDAKLGTLQLQSGFQAQESVTLPADVSALGVSPGPTYSLYAVKGFGKDAALYSLGIWPDLQPSTTKLHDVVTAADRAQGTPDAFVGSGLVNDGKRLVASYTTAAAGAPGHLAVYDIETPAASTYVAAPMNYTAASFASGDTSAVLVNGGGLGTLSGELGVFGLVTSANPFTPVKVASFPAAAASSGFTSVADNGIAVLGYSRSPDYVNVVHAVAPSLVTQALTGGAPVALGDQTQLDVGSNFNQASAFGAGVAVQRGAYDASFTFVATDVSRYALSTGIGGDAVTVGERTAVVTFADQCTSVVRMDALGSDLLLGVSDKNGQRLVRVRVSP
ncbi:hypothetical protein LZ198_17020 [Myxococcus sp. K15C18031901]|uniref:hypothetical protein n=1 Tax=Myxococcus dinghuensis TaxID=2906761 RepID=UPI0020A70444|nr:hypothetical protein [Myxococcus dinghuensis]MCP3100574.1 hypothetical protein [Myxococcus dinghuensis]